MNAEGNLVVVGAGTDTLDNDVEYGFYAIIVPVPEPAAVGAVTGLLLLGVAFWRRHRQQRSV
jgi:hypothetical protein